MTEPIKIDVPNIETKKVKLVDAGWGQVCLYETYFTFDFEQVTDEAKDDDEMVRNEIIYDARNCVKKDRISATSVAYYDTSDVWFITIYVTGRDEMGLGFDSKENALKFYNQFNQWWNP